MLSHSPQSLLFLKDSTLRGLKLSVYVLTKILKFCTGSSAKSYQCKFAISTVFANTDVLDREDLGELIKKVIHYHTLRGKFSSVHPELRQEGIIRVEVGKEGFHFVRDSGALIEFLQPFDNTLKYCLKVRLRMIPEKRPLVSLDTIKMMKSLLSQTKIRKKKMRK